MTATPARLREALLRTGAGEGCGESRIARIISASRIRSSNPSAVGSSTITGRGPSQTATA
ncbi:hypothetical protein ABZ470_11780 [Streptosporangium sp. NPDC020072]|uniref:hypothetical protein n=1 Tax=Streptosporangium sp. NPDC020072 TaxID=3154788 RepID=UPI003429F36A